MNGAAGGEAVGALGPAGPLLLPPPSGDHALSTRAEDALGRAPLAEAVAAHIASVRAEEGVVFGLVGPWGSGKTSLLGMIEDSLRNDHGALVAYFNPWLFSGTEALVGFFFAELGAGLGDLSGKPVQDLGASMQDYGELLGSVRTEPTVGRQAAAAGGPLKRLV
ncbi:MAG: KAP family NTPase [Actinomycetota bacterium]|nr:KAP family NTPase [Actinomycetota bacterium]